MSDRERAWIRQDDRCRLPFRVMISWECYDCTPVDEVARFAVYTDAREFVNAKGYKWLSTRKLDTEEGASDA